MGKFRRSGCGGLAKIAAWGYCWTLVTGAVFLDVVSVGLRWRNSCGGLVGGREWPPKLGDVKVR